MDLGKLLGNILGFFNQGTKRVAGNVKAGMVLRGGVDDYSEQTKKKLDEATRLAKQALQSQDSNKRKLLTDLSRRASGEGMTLDEQMKNQLQQKAGMTFQQGLDQPSYLKQGLGVATDAATWLLPGSGSLKGAAALGAGLGASRAVSEEQDPLTGSILGGVFGAGGYGIGKGIGKGLEKIGKSLALKDFRINPTQYKNLKKVLGKNPENWLAEENLIGKGSGDIKRLTRVFQDKYDDLALKTDSKVNATKFYNRFAKAIDEFLQYPSSKMQKMGKALFEELDLVMNKYKGKSKIPLKEITTIRKTIDKFIPESKFGKGDVEAGVDMLLRRIYKQTIDDATSGATGKIGQKLREFRAFGKILDQQAGLGKGSLPANLTRLLGANITSSGASSVGDALKKSTIGALATAVINNPNVISTLSKGGLNLGQFFQSPAVGGALEKGGRFVGQKANELVDTITQRGSQPMAEPTPTQQKDTSTTGKLVKVGDEEFLLEGGKYYSQDKFWVFDEKLDDWVENPEYQPEQTGMADSDQTKQLFTLLMMQDLQQTGGKNITELKTIFDMVKTKDSDKKTSDGAIKIVNDFESGLENIKGLQSEIESTDLVGPIKGLAANIPYATGSKTLQAQINVVRQTVGKALEGGVLKKEDEEKYKKILPTMTDTKEVAINKLIQLYTLLERDLTNYKRLQNLE